MYSTNSIREERNCGTISYYFAEDLISKYQDIFIHCKNHLRVEDDLIDAGVMKNKQECSGGLFRVKFTDRLEGEVFVNRLNGYIQRLQMLSSN
jgi:hypothetical protein